MDTNTNIHTQNEIAHVGIHSNIFTHNQEPNTHHDKHKDTLTNKKTTNKNFTQMHWYPQTQTKILSQKQTNTHTHTEKYIDKSK